MTTSLVAERLLAISGEDTLTIDRKYREPATLQLPTRIVVLSNELPRLADASGALASRFVTLVSSRSFYGKEDTGLTEKLLAELPGILNWALDGAERLPAAVASQCRARVPRQCARWRTWAAPSAPSSATGACSGPHMKSCATTSISHGRTGALRTDRKPEASRTSAAICTLPFLGFRVGRPRTENGSRFRTYRGIELVKLCVTSTMAGTADHRGPEPDCPIWSAMVRGLRLCSNEGGR